MTIPNGVDLDYFRPYDTESDGKTCLFVGNLGAGNGRYVEIFVDTVWRKLMKKHPNSKLLLVGKGIKASLKNMCSKIGGIEYLGYVHDLRSIYGRSLIVVNPVLKSCGIVNKVLEGMAMARTVVGFSVGFSGIPECVNGENVVMCSEPDELVDALDILFRKPALAIKIGIEARKMVEKYYSWKARKRLINGLYEEAYESFQKVIFN